MLKSSDIILVKNYKLHSGETKNIVHTSEIRFKELYPGDSIQVMDCLTSKYYSDLLYCLYKSPHVEGKYKKLLEPILERLESE